MINDNKTVWIALLLLAIIQPCATMAQSGEAGNVLSRMAQTYMQGDGVSITFSASIRPEADGAGASESFEGSIVMKGEKFVLTTPDMITWFDGVTQWTYVPRNEEVNIITPSRADLRFLNPMMMIRNWEKDFKAEYMGESTSASAKTAVDIALVPKKQDDIARMEIQVEKATSLPSRLVVVLRNNMRNVIVVNGVEQAKIADAQFSFQPEQYPDAEVIDLR